jgi:hypothetical protein
MELNQKKALDVIAELGPISSRELAEEINISYSYARKLVTFLKKEKRIFIREYRRDEDGGKLYPRALYAAGGGKDAVKMKPLTNAEYAKRHKQNKRRVSSVFDLGSVVDKRRLTTKKRPDVVERHRAKHAEE